MRKYLEFVTNQDLKYITIIDNLSNPDSKNI